MAVTVPGLRGAGHYIVSDANGTRSRDHGLMTVPGTYVSGTVLGRTAAPNSAGVLLSRAKTGNTGTGVLTPDATTPVLAAAKEGTYSAVLTTVQAGAGIFSVYDPDGTLIGTHTVAGAAFATEIKFAIADGTPDFALGDTFYLTVSRKDGTWVILAPGGSGGAEVAKGILYDDVVVGDDGPQRVVVTPRDAEVNGALLTWPAGITAAQKLAAVGQLETLGIVVRA